jgi:hypothetical protein
MHLLLAYAGMLIHVLFKLAKISKRKGFKFNTFIKENIFTITNYLLARDKKNLWIEFQKLKHMVGFLS